MKSKKLSRTVQYSANDMYGLVSDIESYPYFVPACKSLEVIKKEKMEISFILMRLWRLDMVF